MGRPLPFPFQGSDGVTLEICFNVIVANFCVSAVLYQVLNKQVPVPVQVPVVQVPVQVPVTVQVLCINYWHSVVTLQLHKVKVVASFII